MIEIPPPARRAAPLVFADKAVDSQFAARLRAQPAQLVFEQQAALGNPTRRDCRVRVFGQKPINRQGEIETAAARADNRRQNPAALAPRIDDELRVRQIKNRQPRQIKTSAVSAGLIVAPIGDNLVGGDFPVLVDGRAGRRGGVVRAQHIAVRDCRARAAHAQIAFALADIEVSHLGVAVAVFDKIGARAQALGAQRDAAFGAQAVAVAIEFDEIGAHLALRRLRARIADGAHDSVFGAQRFALDHDRRRILRACARAPKPAPARARYAKMTVAE